MLDLAGWMNPLRLLLLTVQGIRNRFPPGYPNLPSDLYEFINCVEKLGGP